MTDDTTHDTTLTLPHSLSCEKSVLSTLMRSPERLHEANLEPEHFYLPAHQMIYKAITRTENAADLDLVTFVQSLHDHGLLDHVGGPAGVSDIYTYSPNDAHFIKHVEELRDRYSRRLQIRLCTEAISEAYDCSTGKGGHLPAIEQPLTQISDAATGTKAVKDVRALADAFLKRYLKMTTGEVLPMGIPFGIYEIDQHLPGMHAQHYGIISGRSGSGKSTLACQILCSTTLAGHPGLYLILERTEESAFAKAVIQTAQLHHRAVTDPLGFAKANDRNGPSKVEISSIKQAIINLVEAGIHIRKPDNRKLTTVLAEIRRYVRLHGVEVVYLDQIGLVRGTRMRGDSAEVELKGISNALQELAHELGITIVVLCQETVDGETKNARAIEEDADWWLSIVQERDKKAENFGEHQHVLIAKDSHNGHGGMRLPLILDKDTLRFKHGIPQSQKNDDTPKTRYGN